MPIYEYVCDQCNHDMEAFQKLSEEPLVTCPKCGADSLRKKISAAGFRLKGGGWYETDFKAGKKKNVVGSDSSDGAKSGSDAKTSDSSTKSSSSTDTGSKSSASSGSSD